MPVVDVVEVSTAGLESSPHADALAGLRANEARYFRNKYGVEFVTTPAARSKRVVPYVSKVLLERDIVIASPPLETSDLTVDDTRWTHVIHQSGLVVNVLYGLAEGSKRAVGFKLCEGMDVPEELSGFKFARQKSKLAGTIRGSYFVVKGTY